MDFIFNFLDSCFEKSLFQKLFSILSITTKGLKEKEIKRIVIK